MVELQTRRNDQIRSMSAEWSGSKRGGILSNVFPIRGLGVSRPITIRLSMTAESLSGICRFACRTRLISPDGLVTLQHECAGMRKSPQSGPMCRQHSASLNVIAVPGIRQNIDGARSDKTTIRPNMRFTRFMVSADPCPASNVNTVVNFRD